MNCTNRIAFLLIPLALVGCCLLQSASADVIVSAATDQGDFGTLDLTTGAYSSTGPLGLSPGTTMYGMGFIGSKLYGADNNNPAGFYSINTTTGAATLINTLNVTAIGGTTDGTDFFGLTQDSPPSIFEADASGNVISSTLLTGFSSGDGLAAFGSGSNLYISEYTGASSGDELFLFNTLTSTLSDLGALNDGQGNGQAAFTGVVDGGKLYTTDGYYVYTYNVTPTSLSTLQSTTEITGLNTNTGDYVDAVASPLGTTTTPEPSSLVLFGLGLVVAGGARVRRRFQAA